MARTLHVLSLIALLIVGLSLAVTAPTAAQRDNGDTCPAVVSEALQLLGDNCDSLGRNAACYGYNQVDSTFRVPVEPEYFSAPADLAELTQIETLRTSAMDLEQNRWGIAVMNVQANVPNTMPGQSVMFVMLGDAELVNEVAPDQALIPVEPVALLLDGDAIVRIGPGDDQNELGELDAGTPLEADALGGEDGEWLRILYEGQPGWILREHAESAVELDTLPLIDLNTRSPMQSFYFNTGFGNPECHEAPNAVTVRSRREMTVDLSVNGVDISVGSLITFRNTGSGAVAITVHEGHLETLDGRTVDAGESIAATTGGDGRITDWGDIGPASSLDQQIGTISYLALNEVAPEDEALAHMLDYIGIDTLPALGTQVEEAFPNYIVHIVQEGETLFDIGRLYDANIAEIVQANGIVQLDSIEVGDELIIPNPGSGYISYEEPDETPQIPGDTTEPVDCAAFEALSPLSGLNLGNNTFFWRRADGGVSGYRVVVDNLDASRRLSFTAGARANTLTADLSQRAAGSGFEFAWRVEALDSEGEVACATDRIVLLRSSAPGPDGPGAVTPPEEQEPEPGAVVPVAECVIDNYDGTFDARFGYRNDNETTVTIAVGLNNGFSPTPQNREQPTSFMPGRHNGVFDVTFSGDSLAWTLRGPDGSRSTATANRDLERCADQPAPLPVTPVAECVVDFWNGTFRARFGYMNENAGTIVIPVGENNFFSAPSSDVGQPSTFQPNYKDHAISVDFTTEATTWTLRGPDGIARSATVSQDTERCADQRPPPPRPLVPQVECVIDNYDGTFTARFGYRSDNIFAVDVPIGSNNNFSPGDANRGQPTTFQPGSFNTVATVDFRGSNLVWRLTGPDGIARTATANADTGRCGDQPAAQPVTPTVACVIDNYDGTFTARLGYRNDNPGPVVVPIGARNGFSPPPVNRGQPATFQPGSYSNAFEMVFETAATWGITGPDNVRRPVTVNSQTQRCADQPPPPPEPVIPAANCVIDNYDGTFTARFGYTNSNDATISIPIGGANAFSPAPGNRGQVADFRPGTYSDMFRVTFEGTLTWTLVGPDGVTRSATASADTQRCADQPPPPPTESVRPIVECVIDNYDGSYLARFGYLSDNDVPVDISVGGSNGFNPAPAGRGQPTTFQPGRHFAAFEVTFGGGNLVWSLRGPDGRSRTATANASTSRCEDQPPPPPTQSVRPIVECVIDNYDGTFLARFGYLSDNNVPVDIPIGAANSVVPSGNPPVTFQPGRQFSVFSVPFSGSATWTLTGPDGETRNASANAETSRCEDQPPPPVTEEPPPPFAASWGCSFSEGDTSGTLTVSFANAPEGDTVTVTFTADGEAVVFEGLAGPAGSVTYNLRQASGGVVTTSSGAGLVLSPAELTCFDEATIEPADEDEGGDNGDTGEEGGGTSGDTGGSTPQGEPTEEVAP